LRSLATYTRIPTAALATAMANTIFNFFGLRENPFKINPDPRFLFVTDEARATSAELAYGIQTRKGLILLTGEVGTGKTVLLRRLLDWLSEQKMPTALIFNSHIKPEHLLDLILNDFGVPCTSTLKSEKLLALNRWLLERYRAGQIPVLIVDEAQGLDPTALEQIRLLLNFETPREKLLQIVLAGQPELEIKLKRHELRQLRQRITIRCKTFPLTLEQTCGYILERLRIAGANGNPIFEPDAICSVHAYSQGIPRVINVLCEHSLVNACADGAHTISSNAVEQAARDCQLDRADSVARILNTGSYSTATLSEIGSMLAAISAGADSPAGSHNKPITRPQFSEEAPLSARDMRRNFQPSFVPEPVNSAAREETLPRPEQQAEPSEVSVPVATPSYAPEMAPQPQAFVAKWEEIPAQTRTPEAPDSQTPDPQISFSRSRPSPLAFFSQWGISFLSDLRSTSRQFRRAARSFATRRWIPFVRNLGHQLRQLGVRASQISSDPRWKHLRTRAVSISQTSWNSFKSAVPTRFAQYLGTGKMETHRRVSRTVSPRAKRPRGISSLRRWLHEPLNTAQRKRTEGNHHRSAT
jgi:general secretion pathway protein A